MTTQRKNNSRQKARSFDPSWEKNVYAQSRHLNRYPYTELVSLVFQNFPLKSSKPLKAKALELGFGAGNNLTFLCREGFETYGIEGSKSACQHTAKVLAEQNLSAQLINGDFVNLPYKNSFFDLIIDRQSLCANRLPFIREALKEVYRCLKKGGKFIMFAYTTSYGGILDQGAEFLGDGTYTNFQSGTFEGVGAVHFFSLPELKDDLLSDFTIERMYHHSLDQVVPSTRNYSSEFIVLCSK